MPPDLNANPLLQFVPFLLVFLVFYFIVIKPQKSKQEEFKKLLSDLKKNDQIVTSGGIHGTVINVKDTTAIVRIDDNVKIEIDKEAIGSVKKSNNP